MRQEWIEESEQPDAKIYAFPYRGQVRDLSPQVDRMRGAWLAVILFCLICWGLIGWGVWLLL